MVTIFFLRCGENVVTSQEREQILAAIDRLTTNLHATLDAGNLVTKALVMILLERHEAPSQHAQQVSQLMTVKEVAEFMKVSPSAVYQWVEKKDFPALRAGDDLRFDKDEVVEWMKRHRKTLQPVRLRVVNSR